MPGSGRSARDRLLDRCLDHLRNAGFGRLSLREIAAGAGTSHRMLIYHFGSREGLLAEVVGRIEAEQRQALAELGATGDTDLAGLGRSFWRRISDPELAPAERLFFEIYVQALRGAPWTDTFAAAVIAAWERPLRDLFRSHGFGSRTAARRSRLALAASRGLLLDLLLTGERAAVDAAAAELVLLLTARD